MSARVRCISAGGHEVDTSIGGLLTPVAREIARAEANQWIKRLRLVRYDDESMRERFRYRNESLWWFTELYLHKMRQLDVAVDTTLALEAARERHAPSKMIVHAADRATADAALAFGRTHQLPIELADPVPQAPPTRWSSYLVGLTSTLSRLRPHRSLLVDTRPSIVAFVHTAFWRPSDEPSHPAQESYIGPVLEAVATRVPTSEIFYVGVGPRKNFRARRWWDALTPVSTSRVPVMPIERLATRRALRGARRIWKSRHELAAALTRGDDVRAAAVFRGCDLWPILRRELEGAALVQWPWSARAMDEAGGALDALTPDVVITYAEAGGWGRALVLEARRRQIRSIGVQHGFLYRHWLNYLHEVDELAPVGADRGFPLPDRTLVFDAFAARHLQQASHFPATSIAVTGNARLTALAARVRKLHRDRPAIRQGLGAEQGDAVVVLVAKFSEVRSELADLVRAVAARSSLRLVVKPHPAETADVYAPFTRGVSRISVTTIDSDLARLLAAADGIVTKNSTVAIDALTLGIPALVIGLPNNLSPFVAEGVMLGATDNAEIGPMLERLLYDRAARQQLAAAAERFVDRYGMRPAEGAAERAADVILSMRTHA